MIFNTIEETCEYINELLKKDIVVSQKQIKKVCEINNIEISSEEYVAGENYVTQVNSISLEDNKLKVTYQKQSWLKHIPSLYHDNDFLKRFLAGFQQSHQVIENKIDNISDQFRADKTEYIDWLASWLGISISQSVDEIAKRRLVSDMVRLYSIRGTHRYFIDVIKHLTSVEVRMENIIPIKILHHNLLKKDFTKKLIHVYIDKKISSSKNIEQKKLYFIQMILEHEKPIGVSYKIIYKYADEPLDSSSLDKSTNNMENLDSSKHLEPVSEKIEELKEEFNKGVEEIKSDSEQMELLEEKTKKKDEDIKEKSDEKLFKIDDEVDDYYSYDNLE